MSRGRASATFTTEFGHEFEAERSRLLRHRFLAYTGVMCGLGVLGLVVRLSLPAGPDGLFLAGQFADLCSATLSVALYAGALTYVRLRPRSRVPLSTLVVWLIVVAGTLTLVGKLAQAGLTNAQRPQGSSFRYNAGPQKPVVSIDTGPAPMPSGDANPGAATRADASLGADREGEDAGSERASNQWTVGVSGALWIFMPHFLACVFLPWSASESVRPLIPLLVINALITLLYMGSSWLAGGLTILFSPLIGVPGATVCWWRHSRLREGFHTKLIMRRYGEMRQELFNARQIHEALFPKACSDGPCRFSYRYEPMRQIGGDYLYASQWRRDGVEPVLSLVIIDVTGHGIPAALTVNRLHGEMERIFAEEPGAAPGDVLRLLNRYVHLTLATHSVYVTAVCLRVDPNAGTLEYASGGHPPAFVRTVDGRIEELGSTAFVLGVCAAQDFDSAPQGIPFGPGDVLIVYTDGAIEARDKAGRMYGITGLRRLISQGRPDAVGGWPAAILGEVEAFRFGPAADDTLVIEVVRPLASALAADAAQARPKAAAGGR